MGSEYLMQLIDTLIDDVNGTPQISADGLQGAMYPDDLIITLHSHLGNLKQLADSSVTAFNGTEQFLSLQAAQKELEHVDSNLFNAFNTGLIEDNRYQRLAEQTHALKDVLADEMDPEFA